MYFVINVSTMNGRQLNFLNIFFIQATLKPQDRILLITVVTPKNLVRMLEFLHAQFVSVLSENPSLSRISDCLFDITWYNFQSLSLGLFRSDYLMQQPEGNKLIQVEFNTVASSFGAITTHLPAMSRYRQLTARVSTLIFFERIMAWTYSV